MRIILCAAFTLALAVLPALARDDSMPPVSAPSHGGAALVRSDVEAFADGLVPASRAQGNIAGVVVVVVRNGQVLFEKGYGVSDVAAHTPVDPERTLFRTGSVSKLFVWTAVMQLAGEGKIDLDRDVNAYLDFAIPPAFGRPITMRNLMTHTAGFEEGFRYYLLGDPNRVTPLDKVVRDALPARLFPPGDVPAYSNYGAVLAGYIVQRVSHEPFADYIQHHIFTPLGMAHATFVQPLPPALRAGMSKGYDVASAPPTPFEMIDMAPAGGLSASGGDIARFMLAHLNGGGRILSPQMAARMHGVANRPFSALLPMAYGFWRDDRNGHVVIAHDGDTGVFHSELELLLGDGTGIFLAVNSGGAGAAAGNLRRAFFAGFMDRYFPAAPAKALPTLKTAMQDGQRIAGDYVVSRRSDSSFLHFIFLLQPQSVTVNSDATISVSPLEDPAGQPKRWREIGPFVWQEVNGASRVQAKFRDGRVDQIGSDDFGPVLVLQPAGFNAQPWNFYLLVFTVVVLLLAILFWPIKAVLRWRYERPLPLADRARLLYRLTRVVALIDLVFLVGFPLVFAHLNKYPVSFSPDIDWLWRVLQLIGLLGVLGTPIPIAEFVFALRDPARPWWTKASDLLIALAALATVWFAFSQNLLTFGLKY
ncbi:MAG TPA: serine hydrolase domain-containing protein [Rhizomicrobium sp.]|jgi:CubicO group peptidase (beta-lactamase class C family)|nr:serine hydrolase domain-containing protein [Rhizomicrobium sp.]